MAVAAIPHGNVVLSGSSQFYRCIMINPVLFNRNDPAHPPVMLPEPITYEMPMAVFVMHRMGKWLAQNLIKPVLLVKLVLLR